MVEITARIMHHISRPRPEALLKALRPFAPVLSTDAVGRGAWWNARTCWLSGLESEASHILVVHDDAIACPGFAAAAQAAIEARPNAIVSFYAQRPEMLIACERGNPWVTFDIFAWGLGLCMPAAWAREFVEWRDRCIDPSRRHDDMSVLLWTLETGRVIHCTAPSLLDQDERCKAVTDGKSNEGNTATWFASDGADNINWLGHGLHVSGDRVNFLASRRHHFIHY